MAILVTGASGFLGKALTQKLVARGEKVYGLARHPVPAGDNLVPVSGDIRVPGLGLTEVPEDITAVHHLAAIHNLGDGARDEIEATNIGGTANVIAFCRENKIPHLAFTSTAYTEGRNPYEKSKAICESMLLSSGIPGVTIYKPSIIMGTSRHFFAGHFAQFALLVARVHNRLEMVRKKFEGTLRLPVLESLFRVQGDPAAPLNLISIDDVVDGMLRNDEPGVYWLTHPEPLALQTLADWIGEVVMVRFKFQPDGFRYGPSELLFRKLAKAFYPYLQGDDFSPRSDLKTWSPITRTLIHDTIRRAV